MRERYIRVYVKTKVFRKGDSMDISINNSNRITGSAGRTNAGKSAGENARDRFNVFENEDGKVIRIISEAGIAADSQT